MIRNLFNMMNITILFIKRTSVLGHFHNDAHSA